MKRFIGLFFLPLLFSTTLSAQSIQYDVFLDDPGSHFFRVNMTVQNVQKSNRDTLSVAIPAWCCLYQIRDFAQYVQNVRAQTETGAPLEIRKKDKQTWQVPIGKTGSVTMSYRVFGNDLSPFGTQLNKKHAFINPALILFYLPEERNWPVSVTFHAPANWRILTAATPVPGQVNQFRAASYDDLVDNPVEIGNFVKRSFTSDGARYDVGFYDYQNSFDFNEFVEMLKRIVHEETVEILHDVPFKRYVFLFQIVDSYGSGMEHANSCVISFNRNRAQKNVQDLVSLIAHEFFHVWNVKRIKPKNLFRYDWTKENYTRALWFAEGGTSYYAALVRERAGFWTEADLLSHFAKRITQEENDPGRFVESPEQASFNCWFEKYPWYVRPENSISYYRSGEILSFLLDLKMRLDTRGRFGLDDVLRFMNGWFAKRQVGYNDSADILGIVNSLTGKNYADFFRDYVSGTKRPPYEILFKQVGLRFVSQEEKVPDPGFSAERNFDKPFVVTAVEPRSGASKAGLHLNDQVLKVNGHPTGLYIEDSFRHFPEGKWVDLLVRRGSKTLHLKYRLTFKTVKKYRLERAAAPTNLQKRILNDWLAGLPK